MADICAICSLHMHYDSSMKCYQMNPTTMYHNCRPVLSHGGIASLQTANDQWSHSSMLACYSSRIQTLCFFTSHCQIFSVKCQFILLNVSWHGWYFAFICICIYLPTAKRQTSSLIMDPASTPQPLVPSNNCITGLLVPCCPAGKALDEQRRGDSYVGSIDPHTQLHQEIEGCRSPECWTYPKVLDLPQRPCFHK